MSWYKLSQFNIPIAFLPDHIHEHLPDFASAYLQTKNQRTAQTAGLLKPVKPLETGFEVMDRVPPKKSQYPKSWFDLQDYVSGQLGRDMENSSDLHGFNELGSLIYEEPYLATGSNLDIATQSSNNLIENWNAVTSRDAINLAFQIAAQDLYQIPTAPIVHKSKYPGLYAEALKYYTKYGKSMREFLLAQHNRTTDFLNSAGHSTVPLYRGYGVEPQDAQHLPDYLRRAYNAALNGNRIQKFTDVPTHLQPLSAHALHPLQAMRFAANMYGSKPCVRIMHRILAPSDRVVATPYTGFGQAEESEMVLRGGRDLHGDICMIPPDMRERDVYLNAISPWMDNNIEENEDEDEQD